MQGDPQVLEVLNEVLTAELTAINQYFLHAKMCEQLGVRAAREKIRDESIDEMKHADPLIDGSCSSSGLPNVQRLGPLRIGETVPEKFESDLGLETKRSAAQRAASRCASKRDNGSRGAAEAILVSEEEHVDWLETQLETITQIGAELYLSQQLYS